MAFPKSVPTPTEEQLEEFHEQFHSFEVSDEMEAAIERHREAIREN